MIPLTASEAEKVLKRNGFVHVRTVGSHFQWINVAMRRNVTIPHHGNRQLQQRTLKSIVRQSGLPESAFVR